jgi:hypothetical protein
VSDGDLGAFEGAAGKGVNPAGTRFLIAARRTGRRRGGGGGVVSESESESESEESSKVASRACFSAMRLRSQKASQIPTMKRRELL